MESGWGWATNESGQSGWVPMEYLAALPTIRPNTCVQEGMTSGETCCA